MANDALQVMGGMGYSQTANLLMGELTDCGHDLVAGVHIRVQIVGGRPRMVIRTVMRTAMPRNCRVGS